jgi:hypothetical protein
MDMLKFRILAAFVALSLATGCSILFGNIKPVVEKSSTYSLLDLSLNNTDWSKLDIRPTKSESGDTSKTINSELADVAFQSKKTSSVISFNSICKENTVQEEKDPREYVNALFLGMTNLSSRTESSVTVSGVSGLQTTVKGMMQDREIQIRSIIVQKGPCLYDILYVSKPSSFTEQENEFKRFVESVKIK